MQKWRLCGAIRYLIWSPGKRINLRFKRFWFCFSKPIFELIVVVMEMSQFHILTVRLDLAWSEGWWWGNTLHVKRFSTISLHFMLDQPKPLAIVNVSAANLEPRIFGSLWLGLLKLVELIGTRSKRNDWFSGIWECHRLFDGWRNKILISLFYILVNFFDVILKTSQMSKFQFMRTTWAHDDSFHLSLFLRNAVNYQFNSRTFCTHCRCERRCNSRKIISVTSILLWCSSLRGRRPC